MPTEVDGLALVRSTRSRRARTHWWQSLSGVRAIPVAIALLLALALLGSLLVTALSRLNPHPSVNRFTPTGSLHHPADPNAFVATVVLSDGRVLVAGRVRDAAGDQVDQRYWSEVYDPAAGSFSTASDISQLFRFTLTALTDGRVLVTSAGSNTGTTGRIPHADTSFVLDPHTGTTETTRLAVLRSDPIAVRLGDGRVLVAGGYGTKPNGATGSIADAEIWDPRTGTSTPTGSMVQDRVYGRAQLLPDGRVLVVGGMTWKTSETSSSAGPIAVMAEVYDPRSGTFAALHADPAADPDPVFVVQSGASDRLTRVDMVSGTVSDVTPYPDYIPLLAADATGNPDPSAMDCLPDGRQCREGYSIALIDAHHALVAGGRYVTRTLDGGLSFNPAVAPDLVLDPTTGSLTPAGPVAVVRETLSSVRLADGRVLIFGASDADQSAEIYEP